MSEWQEPLARLRAAFAELSLEDRLLRLRAALSGRIVLTTSFGLEDQALSHAVFAQRLDIAVVTLDTGRLFPETYALWAATERRYGARIAAFYPAHEALEALVARQGIDGFYASVDQRKACCAVRKVEPLARALEGAEAWITGLRAEQSSGRAQLAAIERDATRALLKVSPLFDWSRARLQSYVERHGIPCNPLHDRGYLSIGCQPCTRAVEPGEPERAGRWWWESDDKKECGLHLAADGRLVRRSA
jgi:phosphoadenosine phosphosulfate reductase